MSAASWSSVAEQQKEATELHTFALAYERALTEVMMSEDVTKYPQISRDIGVIIRGNTNPLIKVDLLMERLRNTELGKKLCVKAILSVPEIRFARELSKREQDEQIAIERREQERQIAMEHRIKVAAQEAAAIEAARIVNLGIERGVSYGTYKTLPAGAAAPLANPLTIEFHKPPKYHGGKKSYKKSHKKGGKKSHRKKGGKRSHMKSRRH